MFQSRSTSPFIDGRSDPLDHKMSESRVFGSRSASPPKDSTKAPPASTKVYPDSLNHKMSELTVSGGPGPLKTGATRPSSSQTSSTLPSFASRYDHQLSPNPIRRGAILFRDVEDTSMADAKQVEDDPYATIQDESRLHQERTAVNRSPIYFFESPEAPDLTVDDIMQRRRTQRGAEDSPIYFFESPEAPDLTVDDITQRRRTQREAEDSPPSSGKPETPNESFEAKCEALRQLARQQREYGSRRRSRSPSPHTGHSRAPYLEHDPDHGYESGHPYRARTYRGRAPSLSPSVSRYQTAYPRDDPMHQMYVRHICDSCNGETRTTYIPLSAIRAGNVIPTCICHWCGFRHCVPGTASSLP